MGYTDVEVFAGKDHDGNDVLGGFRFTVDLAQGTEVEMARLKAYLERLYPAFTNQDILDNFIDTNGTDLEIHTMDIGPVTGWVAQTGTITTQGNKAHTPHANESTNLYCTEGASDGTVMAEISFPEHPESQPRGGLVFRYADTNNYWYFRYTVAWHYLELRKVVAGSDSLESRVTLSGDNPRAANRFKVVFSGNSIKCYYNGSLEIDVTDSELQSSTGVGIKGYTSKLSFHDYGWVTWDDFEYIPGSNPDPLLWLQCDDVDDSEPFCEKMDYDSGSTEFTASETLTGASSGATGTVFGHSFTSGSWGDGTAAGTVYLTGVSGTFTNDEALNGSTGGGNMATADGVNQENLPDARNLTTNTIDLTGVSGWTESSWNSTVNITSPVQEILDRPGWESGNSLSTILTPQTTEDAGSKIRMTSYEGGVTSLLEILSGDMPTGKQEYYDAGIPLISSGSNTWLAQTFKSSASNHVLKSVRVYLDRDGSCGTVTASIRNTIGGVPASSGDIVSATKAEGDISTSGGWVCFDLEAAIWHDVTYAIVVRAPSGGASSLWWRYTISEPNGGTAPDPYPSGKLYHSSDSGASWTAVEEIGHPAGSYADGNFEEWASVCS